jgi:hypothetical protein
VTFRIRLSGKPLPPMCSRSSAGQHSISKPCCRSLLNQLVGFARRTWPSLWWRRRHWRERCQRIRGRKRRGHRQHHRRSSMPSWPWRRSPPSRWIRFLPDTTTLTQQLVLMQSLDLLGLRRDCRISPTEAARQESWRFPAQRKRELLSFWAHEVLRADTAFHTCLWVLRISLRRPVFFSRAIGILPWLRTGREGQA